MVQHPEVCWRDCDHCLQYVYDESTGKPIMRGDQLVKRHVASPPPCRTRKGCPKGSPESPQTLTPQNLRAWLFDRECRAVGQWPDDPIVRKNAAIIRHIDDGIKESRDKSIHRLLLLVTARG